jgi:iron-regulated transporter 1
LLGGFSLLFGEASTVAIEKDWVIVIADGCHADYLGKLNISLRQIDLGSKMLSPTVAGFFLMAVGEQLQPALIAVAIINLLSFFIENFCLTKICALVPGLMMSGGNQNESSDEDISDQNFERRHCASCGFLVGLIVYFQQKIASGGLALALLYLNVLSVGDLTTSYLVSRGISLHFIGLWKGVSSVIGIFGARAFGIISAWRSLATTSMLSIAFFLGCLSVSFGSMFVANQRVELALLVSGISISRIGLWIFDLAISQLIQETVPDNCRGIFGGTQHSLQAFFFALHFVFGLIWSKPEHFFVLAAIGYSAVGVAFLLVLLGVYQSRIGA